MEPPQVSAEDAVAIAKMKNIDARTGRLQKTIVGPADVWRAACIEAFPQVAHAPWSVKDRVRVNQHAKRWVFKSEGSTFNDLVMWVALNWAQIITKRFSWMTERAPPRVPDIGFVLGFFDRFVEAFSERQLDEWLSAKDRTELEKLIGKGMDRDEALRELGKLDAAKKLRKEMEEREQRVRAQAAAARADRRAAEKEAQLVERYGGNVPVHPRSRLAQEAREGERKPLRSPSIEAPLQAPKVKFDD
jgi:hypothetical protein